MTHERAWERLPDLLRSREDPQLLAHVSGCHACQRQLFLLGRVERLLRQGRPAATRRRRAPLPLIGRITILATAAAAALALVLHIPKGPAAEAFVLRSGDGRAVARATVAREDRSNLDLLLVARDMRRNGGDQFLLWAQGRGEAGGVSVGRFMVDRTGSCRAHFNLPTGRRWSRFWVTPASTPSVVVATT
jgi:hypothetical protein